MPKAVKKEVLIPCSYHPMRTFAPPWCKPMNEKNDPFPKNYDSWQGDRNKTRLECEREEEEADSSQVLDTVIIWTRRRERKVDGRDKMHFYLSTTLIAGHLNARGRFRRGSTSTHDQRSVRMHYVTTVVCGSLDFC